MTMSHPDNCRCPLHAAFQARRDACYMQLARAILGPDAPTDTEEVVEALQIHAQKLRPQHSLPQAA